VSTQVLAIMLVLALVAGALFMGVFAISAVMLSSEISASERRGAETAANELLARGEMDEG
jgi:uncharacterized membrane protein